MVKTSGAIFEANLLQLIFGCDAYKEYSREKVCLFSFLSWPYNYFTNIEPTHLLLG